MKRIPLVVITLLLCWGASAQIFITRDMMSSNLFPITLEVADSLTSEPIAFASVYLNHPGDSIITHFTLTDEQGKAELKDVPVGEHVLNIEIMGYLPHRQQFRLRDRKSMGRILLVPDRKMLEAARVSAVGNPIEFRQDTIVFNASSFNSAESDVLKDLLKKMPSVEVDSEGNVKVGGKDVSKITVNGKTFFLGDKSAALDNIPAKAVDKVKVIDKESDAAAFSGVKDDVKETVMDVELKDEYKTGVFGNAGLAGGTSIPAAEDNEFLETRPLVWNGNAMVSAFGEKDQLTFVGSGMNVSGPDGAMVYSSNSNLGEGINSSAQAGVNYNTDRIKGLAANATTYWRYNAVDGHSRSSTETFQGIGDEIISFKDGVNRADRQYLHAGVELENLDKSKFTFIFKPGISVSDTHRATADSTSSSVGGIEKNHSVGTGDSHIQALTANGEFTLGVKGLGKEMRSLTLVGNYRIDMDRGTETEIHRTWLASDNSSQVRALGYDRAAGDKWLYLSLQYVEPLSDKWAVQTTVGSNLNEDHSGRDAFNPDGTVNTYYSASSQSHYTSGLARVLMQYNKGPRNLRFGVLARSARSWTEAVSMGLGSTADSGWLTNWAPFVVYRDRLGSRGLDFNARYDGTSDRPDHSHMLPALSLGDPTRLSLGNINLLPSFQHSMSVSLRGNVSEKRQYWSVNGSASATIRPRVDALWFDANSIRYSIPVNSSHPSLSARVSAMFGSRVGDIENLSFSSYSYLNYNRSISYQANGLKEALNTASFDYNAFMGDFWGADGSNFYGGASGFTESLTHSLGAMTEASLRWSGERLEVETYIYGSYQGNRYSFDPYANSNSFVVSGTLGVAWRLPKEYLLRGHITHLRHFGYAAGFNLPCTPATLALMKNWKAWTFSLSVVDIFNQATYYYRDTGDNYVSDHYHNAVGRYVLFGASLRFGKMNPDRASAARDSMWKMM